MSSSSTSENGKLLFYSICANYNQWIFTNNTLVVSSLNEKFSNHVKGPVNSLQYAAFHSELWSANSSTGFCNLDGNHLVEKSIYYICHQIWNANNLTDLIRVFTVFDQTLGAFPNIMTNLAQDIKNGLSILNQHQATKKSNVRIHITWIQKVRLFYTLRVKQRIQKSLK